MVRARLLYKSCQIEKIIVWFISTNIMIFSDTLIRWLSPVITRGIHNIRYIKAFTDSSIHTPDQRTCLNSITSWIACIYILNVLQPMKLLNLRHARFFCTIIILFKYPNITRFMLRVLDVGRPNLIPVVR